MGVNQIHERRENMNQSEFRVAVARRGISNRAMAGRLELSEQAFYNKINGQSEFKNSEIKALAEMLGLSMAEVNAIFFDGEVN